MLSRDSIEASTIPLITAQACSLTGAGRGTHLLCRKLGDAGSHHPPRCPLRDRVGPPHSPAVAGRGARRTLPDEPPPIQPEQGDGDGRAPGGVRGVADVGPAEEAVGVPADEGNGQPGDCADSRSADSQEHLHRHPRPTTARTTPRDGPFAVRSLRCSGFRYGSVPWRPWHMLALPGTTRRQVGLNDSRRNAILLFSNAPRTPWGLPRGGTGATRGGHSNPPRVVKSGRGRPRPGVEAGRTQKGNIIAASARRCATSPGQVGLLAGSRLGCAARPRAVWCNAFGGKPLPLVAEFSTVDYGR
jgi:hypothetical protein